MAPALSLRSRIAASAAALGLLVALGCSGKKHMLQAPGVATGTIQGNITYVRVPLLKDANGVPTGLETNPANFKTLPARGLAVQAYEFDATAGVWYFRQVVYTDANGHYTMTVPAGDGYIVQVASFTQPFVGRLVSVIGDPNGLSSTLPEAQRPRYLLRSSPSGVPSTSTTPLPTASVADQGSYTANFAVDLSTTWQLGSLATGPGELASSFTSTTFESSPTGSRVLAILDDVYAFSVAYGDPTLGTPLDLHYLKGRSEAPGTYIEYDKFHWLQPSGIDRAYDGMIGDDDYFGSIRGASANDDAWDQAILYQLFGRAFTYRQLKASSFGTAPSSLRPAQAPIDGLSPDLAMVEAFPAILAANLLQSPYLADTDGTSALIGYSTISDTSGVAAANMGPYSPRTLAALLWAIDLKANGITAPGTATDWVKMNPAAINRLFALSSAGAGVFTPQNIYLQLGLLKNTKTSNEPVDLAAIFTDTTINSVASPFNLPWPQPTATVFGQSWTSAPPAGTVGTYSYSGTLSMSSDTVQVNGAYPNASYKEIAYLGVSQAADQTYNLTLATTPNPLPSGAKIQVTVFAGTATQAYTFTGSTASPTTFTLAGNGSTTAPVPYPIMVRLLSPTTAQSDLNFTLTLAPAPPGTLRGPVLGQ